MDILQAADPADIHFQIIRMPAPSPFELNTQITYELQGHRDVGDGSVRADLSSVSATMMVDPVKNINDLNRGVPGKLISAERFGVLSGASAEGDWTALGAYVVRSTFGLPLSRVEMTLREISIKGPSSGEVAFTRQIFYGPRLEFLIGCLWTPLSDGSAQAGRIEELAFGRRVSVRDLRAGSEKVCATAVVYDGLPLGDTQGQALWLALSFLAGGQLQSSATETYDANGDLIERTYRPGITHGPPGNSPFHQFYAPYLSGVFANLCDKITVLLQQDFPIDVPIAHLQDANEGAMERRMQSSLLGIHAASEAWNRAHGAKTFVLKDVWDKMKQDVADAAAAIASTISANLALAVRDRVMSANNVGTNARLREFLQALSLVPDKALKTAMDLRNPLFHDGYLQRRFSGLPDEAQQRRYDQSQMLREFLMRVVFAVCEINVPIHSIVNPYQKVNVADLGEGGEGNVVG